MKTHAKYRTPAVLAGVTLLVSGLLYACLLYTSDAADEMSEVELGGVGGCI